MSITCTAYQKCINPDCGAEIDVGRTGTLKKNGLVDYQV